MPNRVILHAGLHKTGTTALQKAFGDQRHRLAKAGIFYPDKSSDTGDHDWPMAIIQNDRLALRRQLQRVQGAKTVLLSSELIGCLTQDQLQTLRRSFPGASFDIIVVLRHLPGLWPSHWRELIKHGSADPFSHYLAELNALKEVRMASPIQPTRILTRLAAVFGRDAIRIMIFDAHPRGPDYGVSFVRKAFGFLDANAFATDTMNLMPDAWKIELGRVFNALGIGWVNHIGRKSIFNAAIGKLRFKEEAWVSDFRALLEQREPVVLYDRTPLVAGENTKLLDRFGDRIIDPVDALFSSSEAAILCLDHTQLPAALELALKKEFRGFRLKLTNSRTLEEQEFLETTVTAERF